MLGRLQHAGVGIRCSAGYSTLEWESDARPATACWSRIPMLGRRQQAHVDVSPPAERVRPIWQPSMEQVERRVRRRDGKSGVLVREAQRRTPGAQKDIPPLARVAEEIVAREAAEAVPPEVDPELGPLPRRGVAARGDRKALGNAPRRPTGAAYVARLDVDDRDRRRELRDRLDVVLVVPVDIHA